MELYLIYIIPGRFTVVRASTIPMSGVYVLEDLCSNKIQNKIIQKMNAKNGFTREITNEKFLERKETQGFSGKARE